MCEIFWGSKCTPKKLASHDLVNMSHYFHQYPLCYLFPKNVLRSNWINFFNLRSNLSTMRLQLDFPSCLSDLPPPAGLQTRFGTCDIMRQSAQLGRVLVAQSIKSAGTCWTAGIMLPLRPLTQPHLVSRMSRISGKGPGTNKCWRNETLSKHLEAP